MSRRYALPPGDPRHGNNGYSNLGCRCEICRAENAWYNFRRRAVRAQLLADGLIEREHGTLGTYFNYGCRCDACRQANTDYYRGLKAKRRAGVS